jgi:cob(I)alamin adenosyltransferase
MRLKGGRFDPLWLCTGKEEALAAKSTAHEVEEFTAALEDVHGILGLSNLQFGYRVIDEVSGFVGHALQKVEGNAEEVVRIAFDLQLRQKVIPKLSGGRELEEPLGRLLHYCLDGERIAAAPLETVRASARERLDPRTAAAVPHYPGSARKLLRMLDRLDDVGFVGALE